MLTDLYKLIQSQVCFKAVNPLEDEVLAMPDNVKLNSLEKLAPGRYRERYAMQTSSADAFISYVNTRDVESVAINSIDPDSCTAQAIFNATDVDKNPGHCDDTASCVMRPLPVYKFLQSIGEQEQMTQDQRGVIDIIRDWHEYMPDATELVGGFTKLTVEGVSKASKEERDFGVERSAMEKIDVKSNDGGAVPSEIKVKVVPYDGFQEREVVIGVSALINRNEDIQLRLRVRGYEALKLAIAEEFAAKLTKGLEVAPIIGTIKAA